MRKSPRALIVLGLLTLSLVVGPLLAPAAPPPGESSLSDAQKAQLTAALAEKQPYAQLIGQATAAGMGCEDVVLYLCKKADADPALVYEIVYAAITGGCDAGSVVSGALRAGAGLDVVVRAASAAGASRAAITAAAAKSGVPPEQISAAFAASFGGAVTGGGRLGDGSALDNPTGSGPAGGGTISGGTVGGGGGTASPYKP
jgi:hypothetical protein